MNLLIEDIKDAGKGQFPCPSCGSAASDDYAYPYCPRGCSEEQLLCAMQAEEAVARCVEHVIQPSQACLTCATRVAWVRREATRRLALAEADDGDGWAPQSLVDAEPVPPPSVLQVGDEFLLRRGWIALLHGEYASGKTPVAYLAVVEQVRAGAAAMIVDYEMGRPQAVALLRELGLTDDEIEAGVYYLYQPPPLGPGARRRVVAEVEALGRELAAVVIDSLTESMASVPGTSDNDAQDVTTWANSLPVWLRDQFDAAVIVIDHSGVNDGPRPSGSHKKREIAQFHLWCRKEVPFSRVSPGSGRSSLVVMKDRSGDRAIKATVAVARTAPGGSFYLVPPTPPKEGEVEVPLDAQPEGGTEEEVYADLQQAGREGMLKTALCGSGERGIYRRQALARLVHQGRAVERPEPGSARGRRYWSSDHAPE